MTAKKAQGKSLATKTTKNSRRAACGGWLFVILLALTMAAMPAAQGQTFSVLHAFTGPPDGEQPAAHGLLLGTTGNIYGATTYGGAFDYGTVFELTSSGESLLHSFLGGEGLRPSAGLVQDAAGNLYGTASLGGTPEGGGCAHGCGVVFKRDTSGNQTVLYAFTGQTDGGNPDTTMIRDSSGNLYGTTSEGGLVSCEFGRGCGVIFKINSSNQETVLYRFTGGKDGDFPAGVVADSAGNLYGTTYDGGAYGYGDVYKLTPSGEFSVLYSFSNGTDSNDPAGPVILDSAGNIYGTTYGVYGSGFGIVYKLSPAGNFTVLYTFTGGSDGSYPGNLVMDQSGNLYGTTLAGGTSTGCYYTSCGTVFKIDTSGNFSMLYSFNLTYGQLPNSLTIDKAGNLYGTTLGGGEDPHTCPGYKGCGVVFKLTP
jgi:uncharacterized repeat protein (TIGR03803 family)